MKMQDIYNTLSMQTAMSMTSLCVHAYPSYGLNKL